MCLSALFTMKNAVVFDRFFASLRTCLIQIHGFATLMHEVETIRTKKYDSSNVMHEKLLSEVC